MYKEVETEAPISFAIVGSGTAGLISALMLRVAFPNSDITVVSSSTIGIVGVGEGSTEHWKQFMDTCRIPVHEMIAKTGATHKYGIRFEGWSSTFPDYFHSVSGDEAIYAFQLFATYMGFLEAGQSLTSQTSSIGLVRNQIRRENLHGNTNQFHFDTFKLNSYFTELCVVRQIRFVDGDVGEISFDPDSNNITSVTVNDADVEADFWIDASGFSRVLISKYETAEWQSFSKYLLCDSAIAFPTLSDPSGQIRPYTRARAMSSGWVWEIPTQERRGNGYVYSSAFLTEEQAVDEVASVVGRGVVPARRFKFDPGYMKGSWANNCCAIGLASSFVEPLEATSIGSTIQQLRLLIPSVAAYKPGNKAMQKKYNSDMDAMMDNILTMIRMHYMSDNAHTPFWRACSEMPINNTLAELLELWSERTPSRMDVPHESGQMFLAPHFFHVAQGQGLLNPESAGLAIHNMGLRERVDYDMNERRRERYSHELVDHAQALFETTN
jgi:tryptophan halogenase